MVDILIIFAQKFHHSQIWLYYRQGFLYFNLQLQLKQSYSHFCLYYRQMCFITATFGYMTVLPRQTYPNIDKQYYDKAIFG